MIISVDILAAGDPVNVVGWMSGWGWLVIMGVLWAIGKIAQSAAKKQAQQRQAEKDRQAQLRRSDPGPPSPDAAFRTSTADQQPTASQPEPTATDEIADAVLGAMGLTRADVEYRRRRQRAETYRQARASGTATAVPPPVAQQTPPPSPPAQQQELGGGVGSELQRQQRRLRMIQQQRATRLVADVPSEADTAAIEARLLSIDSARREGVVRDRAAVTVDLHHREQLRKAIIYHEIFSPPKALRQGAEMWDM